MKITKRLISWGEIGAEIWASYWLLILGSGLVFLSVLLKWVEFPFSRNLAGYQLPLLHGIGLLPHTSLFSFGVLGAVVLLAGLFFFRFSPLALVLATAILLTLFAITPGHIAFQQPSMLRRLTDELQITPLVRLFTKNYLPQNYGRAEDLPKHLVLYTAWGRFLAATSFLRLGWYSFGLGSLLIAGYALHRLRADRVAMGLVLFGLPLATATIVSIPSLIGQHYFTSGSVKKAQGDNEGAIADFRKAMRWDAWHAEDIDLYATIGELQRLAGIAADSPERHISRAVLLRNDLQYEPAIFEFDSAIQGESARAATARRESARARIDLGLALYQAGGIGSAVTNWEQALAQDPTQVFALPYLARGYYDIGSYPSAIQTVDKLADIVQDHNSLVGDAYSLGGDAYAKLGRDADSRHYYNLSLSADPIENYWALTGLIGE